MTPSDEVETVPGRERAAIPLDPSLVDRARLPGLAPLWDELARRVGASDRPVRAVRLTGLRSDQQEALADLLGWARLPGPEARVSVDALATAFSLDTHGLRQLLERLRGPLPDRSADRAQAQRDRERLWTDVAEAVGGRGLEPWVVRLRAAGVPDGDVEAHRAQLQPLLRLIGELPLDPPVPLPVVAQRATGDPHALDQGWLRTTLADAAATMRGHPTPRDAESTRSALRGVGIVPDQLSVAVSSIGLRPTGGDPVARYLVALADAGEPASLTASQLRRWPVAVDHARVWVVENPSVIEAIARAGIDAPVVCTSSWPTDAVVVLLDQLLAGGAALRYHSDLDGAGLALTGHLQRRFGAEPWRMTAADYLDAVSEAQIPLPAGDLLPETPWDPDLRTAMLEHRRAVYEEQVLAHLLRDLQHHAGDRPPTRKDSGAPNAGRSTDAESSWG